MSKFLRSIVRDEDGATAVEYGLIVALVSIGIVVVLATVGTNLSTVFNTVASNL